MSRVPILAGKDDRHDARHLHRRTARDGGGRHSHGMGYGDLLFVSGQLGIRQDGPHTADCNFEVRARPALQNVLAVLRAAGSGPQDVLKVTA